MGHILRRTRSTTRSTTSSRASPKYGIGFSLVAVAKEPAPRLVVQVGKGRTGGDHHPHRRFGVVARILLPLSLGNQEFA